MDIAMKKKPTNIFNIEEQYCQCILTDTIN